MLTEQNGIQVDKFYPPTDWQYSFPEGYTRLEYLQSSGTQYIDTGLSINLNDTILCDVSIQEGQLQTNNFIFGAGTTDTQYKELDIYIASNDNAYLYKSYNGYALTTGYTIYNPSQSINQYNNRLLIRTILENNQYNYYVNNNLVSTQSSVSNYSCNNLTIFSTARNNNWKSKIKLYSFVVQDYQTQNITHNFVPVLRKSDNEIGMLDLVEGKFYPNEGTGEFVMGPTLYQNKSQIDIRQKNNTNFVEKYKFNANNELVWANPQLNLSGPVNYTKVGSPTIEDNVASGFSDSNYLKIGQIPTVQNRLERQVKIKTSNTTGSTQTIMSTGAYAGIRINDANQIGTIVYINGSYSNITLNTVLNGNTEYIYKDVFENGTLTIYLYNYQMVLLETKSASIGFDENTNYNLGQSSGRIFTGSIDLENTYIKVDNNYIMKGHLTDSDRAIATGKGWDITG